MLLIGDVGQRTRVHLAAARSHQQAVHRRESHRSIDAPPAVHGGHRGTVADMAGHHLRLREIETGEFAPFLRHELVARTVKTVTPYAVLLVIFIGKPVDVAAGRHGLVERRIETYHLRYGRTELLHGVDTFQVGRVVQRGQLHELFYPIYHLVVHEHAPVEEITAVRHTVSDRPDIVQGGYHARFGIGDGLEDKVYPFRMVGNVRRELQTRFARRLMGDDAAFDTDAFYEPLGKKRVLARGDHVDNLILYRRAAAVQYKNYHFSVKMCRLEYINYMSFTTAPLPHRESLPPSHRPRPAKSRHTITLPAA